MRRVLPGPFTFILNANANVPKIFKRKKKTIGIRIPDSNLVREIVEEYGTPIVTASIKRSDDEISEYPTDPYEIHNSFENKVQFVIDGGPGGNLPSTVLDCTKGEIEVIREGKGETALLSQ